MLTALFKRIRRDRRGATAVVVALMIVPLILLSGAAVDFARVASARAQLQAAADAGAIAGTGTYKNEQNSTNARNVAVAAFNSSAASLASYATVNSVQATPAYSATVQCSSAASGSCYSVSMTASATLKNSLLGSWIPNDALSVSATAKANAATNGNCANCVNANSATGVTPGGSSGNVIVSSYHVAGVGSADPQTDNSNNGSVDKFNIFLNGDNSLLPPSNSYIPPTANTSDPCNSSNTLAQTITSAFGGAYIKDATGNVVVHCQAGSGACTLPAGTYCGNLSVASGMTVTFAGPVYIEDGNLLVSPNAVIACNAASTYPQSCNTTNTTNMASQYVPVYFGGTSTGSMVLQQQTQIDPSGIQNGIIQYISTFNSVNLQTNGTVTNLEAGVCQDADSYCSNPYTPPQGSIVYSGAGQITYNDTYVTTITISYGAEVSWAQTETLATSFVTGSNTTNITQTVTYSGTGNGTGTNDSNLQKNSTQSSSYTPSSITPANPLGSSPANYTLNCQQLGANNSAQTASSWTSLYHQSTVPNPSANPPGGNPNLGYSYASPNIVGDGQLSETIDICGIGSALASNDGSGTGTQVSPTGSSTNPVLTN